MIKVKLFSPKAKKPVFSSDLAAGCDISVIEGAVVYPDEVVGLKPKNPLDPESELVECKFNDPSVVKLIVKRHPVVLRTGIGVQLEPDQELELRGRSGLGFKYDIIPFNGTIDADYTGEIKVKIWNLGTEPFVIEEGMKIAQGVIKQIVRDDFVVIEDEFEETKRGSNGFGSTGLK